MPTPSPRLLEAATRSLSAVPQTHGSPRTHEEFLRLDEVKKRTAKGKTSIYTDPTFPKPIKLNSGTRRNVRSVWLASEIDIWMQMRIKASRPDPGPVDDTGQVAS